MAKIKKRVQKYCKHPPKFRSAHAYRIYTQTNLCIQNSVYGLKLKLILLSAYHGLRYTG